MKDIVLLGLNHKTAPVEIRECLAFSREETVAAVDRLARMAAVQEVVLFSTCNRVEVLMVTPDREAAVKSVKNFLVDFKTAPASRFEKALYLLEQEKAVHHVFRVAASLDSMMVGEPQILGQIKEAYRLASRRKTTGVILNALLHKAFFVAKKVRSETGIGGHAVSISYAAIEMGRKIFGTLEGKKVLLIGAGEMAELAVEHLIRHRVGEISVANRTFARGLELARRFKGRALRFEEIGECLKEADIIISSTGAQEFVVTRDQVGKGLMRHRKNRPLFFIDIAVPRDIDPAVNRLENAYVYDIDDLRSVVDENLEERRREAVKGERIVDEAVIRFMEWYENLAVVPTIVALREKLSLIARGELKKTSLCLKHLSEEDQKALARMTDAMINKILHDPTLFLKKNGFHGDRSLYLDMTRKLFKLDEPE